jgi:hypothetical protein
MSNETPERGTSEGSSATSSLSNETPERGTSEGSSATSSLSSETFDFDGRPVPFAAGQSVGAALVAAGILSWRITRVESRPRGIFCGIGICFDCLVTVDGRPNERACLVPAEVDMTVRRQEGTGRDRFAL